MRWVRNAPDFDRLTVCMECSATFVKWASDRADTPEEYLRLMGLRHRLAGEVWSENDRSFWFNEPLFHRPTAPEAAPVAPSIEAPPRRVARPTSTRPVPRPRVQRTRRH